MSAAGAEKVRAELGQDSEETGLERNLFSDSNAKLYAAQLWRFFISTHPELVTIVRDTEGNQIERIELTIEEALLRSDAVLCEGRNIPLSVFAASICARANRSSRFAICIVQSLEN